MNRRRRTKPTRLTPFRVDPAAGSIHIGDAVRLVARQDIVSVEASITPWLTDCRDLSDRYRWLTLGALSFGGLPAGLSLCFEKACLSMACWGVALPEAQMEDDWPTRATSEAEVAFIRRVLAEDFGLAERDWPSTDLAWGTLWSYFDPRSYSAQSGLCYRNP